MKTIGKTLIATSLCLLAAMPAYAGHGPSRFWQRMEHQRDRIENGIEAGDLTRREARVLSKQQDKIRRLALNFRDDGRLSKKDRRKLNRKLDKASDHIRALRHNDEYRHARHRRHREYDDGGHRGPRHHEPRDLDGIVGFWTDDDEGGERYGFVWW